jgi:hypothetical protein
MSTSEWLGDKCATCKRELATHMIESCDICDDSYCEDCYEDPCPASKEGKPHTRKGYPR